MNKRKLLSIPLITALLIVLVIITPPISIGVIPFSLQPLFIAIIALLLDWKTSIRVIALYILIGFLGLPVFSGGKNGVAVISSGTVGFILGFFPYAILLSLTNNINNIFTFKIFRFLIIPLIALITLYVCGFLSIKLTLHWSVVQFYTMMGGFFILDLIKLIIAFSIVSLLKPVLHRFI